MGRLHDSHAQFALGPHPFPSPLHPYGNPGNPSLAQMLVIYGHASPSQHRGQSQALGVLGGPIQQALRFLGQAQPRSLAASSHPPNTQLLLSLHFSGISQRVFSCVTFLKEGCPMSSKSLLIPQVFALIRLTPCRPHPRQLLPKSSPATTHPHHLHGGDQNPVHGAKPG